VKRREARDSGDPDGEGADDSEDLTPHVKGYAVRRQTEYDVVASIGGRRRNEQSDERAEDRATSRAEDKLADAERRATGDHADGHSTNQTRGYVECPESRCEAYKRRQSIDGEAKEQDAKAAETEKAENDAAMYETPLFGAQRSLGAPLQRKSTKRKKRRDVIRHARRSKQT
jgi:hypothetical protein